MRIASDRAKLPLALTLITIFTAHLLFWYPMEGENLATLGDQDAAHALQQWHRWNWVFILCLAGAWATLYTVLRRSGDRSPIIAAVTSATTVLVIILLEVLLLFLCVYIRYSLFHAK